MEAAARGEGFIIAKAGKLMVKVVAIDAPAAGARRRLGFLAGAFSVPEDFDRMAAAALIEDEGNVPTYSAARLWGVAIKAGLGRADFAVDAGVLRRGLLDNGYEELAVTGAHAAAVAALPSLHRDPFDRMLVAQALVEGVGLVTADAGLAWYPGAVRLV